MIDHSMSVGVHGEQYAIIGTPSQAQTCDNRDCDNRTAVANRPMPDRPTLRPEAASIFERLTALGLKQRHLAQALDLEENKISKVRSGERQFKAAEVLKANAWLSQVENEGSVQFSDHLFETPVPNEYVPIEVLPTYAGAGGGGTGDGDPETALVPRALIVDVLRGRPNDFLLINIRGDSMEPDFRHGDQLLVDCRDKSPAQPGPFALWDGEWGEYVVKNVERSTDGEVRIFSSNAKYSSAIVRSENTRIIGRPVWFGRRL